MSIGAPGGGILVNPVLLAVRSPAGPSSTPTAPTPRRRRSTSSGPRSAPSTSSFPRRPPISIGDISFETGGRMKRHATHQAGRDVDFGFYYKSGLSGLVRPGHGGQHRPAPQLGCWSAPCSCAPTSRRSCSTPGSSACSTPTPSRSARTRTGSTASSSAARARPRRSSSTSPVTGPITTSGSTTASPRSSAAASIPYLVQLDRIKPPVYTVAHLVRAGETLGHIAARYGTSVRAIQQTNGLSGTLIRAGRVLRIPLRGVSAPPSRPRRRPGPPPARRRRPKASPPSPGRRPRPLRRRAETVADCTGSWGDAALLLTSRAESLYI